VRNFSVRASSRAFFVYAFCLAALILIVGPISAQAASVGISGLTASCGGSVDITAPQIIAQGNTCPFSGITPQSAAVQPPVTIPGVVTASASGSVSNGPPGVSASVSITQSAAAAVSVGGSAVLDYYMQINPFQSIGGVPIPSTAIPVNFAGSIPVSCSFFIDCTGVGLYATVGVEDVTTSQEIVSHTVSQPSSPQTNAFGDHLSLDASHTYEVQMNVIALNSGCPINSQTCMGTISVDPVLYVDPSDPYASDYQLVFSDGIINIGDGLSTTPLPATLPLFATGFAGLGLLGWRRKRKARAVA
jgi:hypothetical protein